MPRFKRGDIIVPVKENYYQPWRNPKSILILHVDDSYYEVKCSYGPTIPTFKSNHELVSLWDEHLTGWGVSLTQILKNCNENRWK